MIGARSKQETRVPLTICIILFLVTFFLNEDFEIGFILNYAIIAAFMALSVLLDGKVFLSKITLIYFFLAAVVVIYSFLPNSVRDPESNNHALSIMIFFLCCALSMPSEKEISMAKKILVIAAFLMAIYIVLIKLVPDIYWNYIYPYMSEHTQEQAVSLMKYYGYGVPIGGSANYADYILALALFICSANLFSNYSDTKMGKWYIVLCALFVVGMVIQNRRSELISAVASVLLMYLLSVRLLVVEPKRFRRAMLAIGVVIIGLIFMYSRGMLDRYIDTFIGIFFDNGERIEEVGNGRIELWNSAFTKFKSSPLIGIGWNQFRATNDIFNMYGMNVHNDYLQWLCETGVIGFTLIFTPTLVLWISITKTCRRLFKNKDSNRAKSYALVSFGIQTFFMMMHFMDPCFYKLMFWPMFSFSIILYNCCKRELARKESCLNCNARDSISCTSVQA